MKIRTTAGFRLRRLAGLADREKGSLPAGIKAFFWKCRSFLRRDMLEKEIYNSCILLKNLAIVYRDLPMSVDFILEELMEGTRLLKTVYADILSSYRNGRGKEAFAILKGPVPTKTGRAFSALLEKLEKINPAELVSYMEAFEETVAAERMTRGVKIAAGKNILVTCAATAAIFMIMLNFIVVVVFMSTLELLGHII